MPVAQSPSRAALVTGGSSGIGAEVARALARRGWHCVLVARGEERLRAVADEIGGEAELCDVADREAVDALAERVGARHPRLGLLVNAAGIPGRTTFLSGEAELIERVLAIDYLGTVWCTRAFLPSLEAARPSDIVNVVSVAGTVAWAPAGPYAAAKAAQLAFSRATEVELRPRGVRVHTVNPGFVATEGFPQTRLVRRPVLGRLVVGPEAIARHVLGVLDRDRRETFVPVWYRVAPIAQALVPGLVARRGGRFSRKRGV